MVVVLRASLARVEAERDARPEITPEDAGEAWAAYTLQQEEQNAAFHRVGAALRAHAAKAAPVSDGGERCGNCLGTGAISVRYGVTLRTETCPTCNGTGRAGKGGDDGHR